MPFFRDQEKGYSLIEIIIGIAVISVLALGITGFFRSALAMITETERSSQAIWLARRVQEDIRQRIDEAGGIGGNEIENIYNRWDGNNAQWQNELTGDAWEGWEEFNYQCNLNLEISDEESFQGIISDYPDMIEVNSDLEEYMDLLYIEVEVEWEGRFSDQSRSLSTILFLN